MSSNSNEEITVQTYMSTHCKIVNAISNKLSHMYRYLLIMKFFGHCHSHILCNCQCHLSPEKSSVYIQCKSSSVLFLIVYLFLCPSHFTMHTIVTVISPHRARSWRAQPPCNGRTVRNV